MIYNEFNSRLDCLINDNFEIVKKDPTKIGIDGIELEILNIAKFAKQNLSTNDMQKLEKKIENFRAKIDPIKKFARDEETAYNSFSVKSTRADGACALHAFGQLNKQGTYQLHDQNGNALSNIGAKQYFGNSLKKSIKNRIDVQDQFVQVASDTQDRFSSLLRQTNRGKKLFGELSKIENQGEAEIAKAKKNRDAKLKSLLFDGSRNLKREGVLQELVEMAKGTSRFFGKSDTEILETFNREPSTLSSLVNADKSIKDMLDERDRRSIDQWEGNVQREINRLNEKKREFFLREEFINHYCETIKSSSYYLDDQEVKLAALTFNQKAQIVMELKSGKRLELEVFNPHLKGNPILLHHRGLHYSRCVRGN